MLEKQATFKEVSKIKLIPLKEIFQEILGDVASQISDIKILLQEITLLA